MSLNYIAPTPEFIPVAQYDKPSYILALRFMRANPTWSIDSAHTYCMREYSHHGITKRIFADALHSYIMEK